MTAEGRAEVTPKTSDHSIVREYYDYIYYENVTVRGEVPNHYRRLARRFRPWQGRRLLDVGCGTGVWLRAATALGALPAGVDISQVALDACRRDLPAAELHCGPAESLPFSEREFDFISCLGALEHFVEPHAALREMIRVAKPGALFLLLVPNAGFLTRRLGFYSGTQQAGVREEVRSLQGWQELFESVGLRVCRRWRDLHVLSPSWIFRGPWHGWPLRAGQSLALPFWPLSWQYQIYHVCAVKK
jgi:ubiquinone/menaquinone biosynthesis C-methylase UbiE